MPLWMKNDTIKQKNDANKTQNGDLTAQNKVIKIKYNAITPESKIYNLITIVQHLVKVT